MFDYKYVHYCSKTSKNLPGCSLWYPSALRDENLTVRLESCQSWHSQVKVRNSLGHVHDVRARITYWVIAVWLPQTLPQYPHVQKIVTPLTKSIAEKTTAGNGKKKINSVILMTILWRQLPVIAPTTLAVFAVCGNTRWNEPQPMPNHLKKNQTKYCKKTT